MTRKWLFACVLALPLVAGLISVYRSNKEGGAAPKVQATDTGNARPVLLTWSAAAAVPEPEPEPELGSADMPPWRRYLKRETLQAINQSLTKLALQSNPVQRQERVDTHMRRLGPYFEDLFDSWDLDPATAREMLKLVRERETEFGEIDHRFNNAGMDGLPERSASRSQAIAWADAQMRILLKEEQFLELSREEARVIAESAARGMQVARDLVTRK